MQIAAANADGIDFEQNILGTNLHHGHLAQLDAVWLRAEVHHRGLSRVHRADFTW